MIYPNVNKKGLNYTMIKNKMLAVIFMMTASLMLSGCAENNTAENASSETSAAMSTETEEYPDFDVINKITVGDKKVSLPFNADELGDGFYVDNYLGEEGKKYSDYCLYYSDKPYAFVELNDENLITQIEFAYLEEDISIPVEWFVYSFDINSTADDITKQLGVPDDYFGSEEDSDGMYTYVYDSGVFSVFFRDDRIERMLIKI